MKYELSKNIELKEEYILYNEFLIDNNHQLFVEINEKNKYASLNFSSRLAMYEFAKAIMQEAVFGESSSMEFYPMSVEDEKLEVINGARMSLDSARIFITYPDQ